jgi:hypothetical protein
MPTRKQKQQKPEGQAKTKHAQFWLTFPSLKHSKLRMWISVFWRPDETIRDAQHADWLSTNEAWSVYDFFRWAVIRRKALADHKAEIEAWYQEDLAVDNLKNTEH